MRCSSWWLSLSSSMVASLCKLLSSPSACLCLHSGFRACVTDTANLLKRSAIGMDTHVKHFRCIAFALVCMLSFCVIRRVRASEKPPIGLQNPTPKVGGGTRILPLRAMRSMRATTRHYAMRAPSLIMRRAGARNRQTRSEVQRLISRHNRGKDNERAPTSWGGSCHAPAMSRSADPTARMSCRRFFAPVGSRPGCATQAPATHRNHTRDAGEAQSFGLLCPRRRCAVWRSHDPTCPRDGWELGPMHGPCSPTELVRMPRML